MHTLINRQFGFSLVELITVIILLGIISVVAIGKFDNKGFDERGYTDELTSAIRYAQKTAVANNCASKVNISTTKASVLILPKSLSSCTASSLFTRDLPNPITGERYEIALPTGVAISPKTSIIFLANGTAEDLPSTTVTTIDLIITGNSTRHICVVKESGYTYQQTGVC